MPSLFISVICFREEGMITCKKARIWTFFWLDRNQYGWFSLFWLAKMPPSVSCCWFQSAFFLASWAVNTHASSLWNFLVLLNLKNVKIEFHPLKYFPSHRKLKICSQKIHRSFEFNLIPATSYRSDKNTNICQLIGLVFDTDLRARKPDNNNMASSFKNGVENKP